MNHNYYFGINNERIGPLDEPTIRDRVASGTITGKTLAWCESMDDWKPIAEIAELMQVFGEALGKQVGPPSLPAAPSSPVSSSPASDPPSVPRADPAEPAGTSQRESSGGDLDPAYQLPQGLSGLGGTAYHIVFWLFRPWRGRPSLVRKFVRENPKRAVPVAAATLGGLFLLFCLALAPIVGTFKDGDPRPPQQQAPARAGGGGNPYQPLIEAQRETSHIINDAYKYNRDSFDQQSETYRRANYDWYNDRND